MLQKDVFELLNNKIMNKIKHNLKIFFLFSKFSLKTTFQTRLGVIFLLLGKAVRFLFFFSLIYFIFARVKLLKGYTINQAAIFYLTFNLIDTISQILFREVYRFRPLVVSGDFDTVLTKPYHPLLRILLGGVDYLDVIMIVPYVLLTIFFAGQNPSTTLLSTFNFSLLIFNSLLMATAFHISVLAFGVITTEVDNTIIVYRDLTSLGRFPIDIYQRPLREIFTFIIPVGVMMTFPAKALFCLLLWPNIAYIFIIGIVLFWLSLKFWYYALRTYQSWGG